MCQAASPMDVRGAIAMLDHALNFLNGADVASLPGALQAEALRALERAESKQTAARARVLAAFAGQCVYEADGQRSARSWLAWHTKVSAGAAAGAVAWARRAGAHPAVLDALASGRLSSSWGREICRWSEALPADRRSDADEILVQAATSGARLEDLAALANEMWERARDHTPCSGDESTGAGCPGGKGCGGSPGEDSGTGSADGVQAGQDGYGTGSADGVQAGQDGYGTGSADGVQAGQDGCGTGSCGTHADGAPPRGQLDDDGFEDRWFGLGITFGGVGRAEGDLSPGCAAALQAVLEALSKKAGPEDTRTAGQRRHDALAEACRRLLAAGLLPDRAGQPTQAIVHITLAQLRGMPGAGAAEAAWIAAAAREPGWLADTEADAAACDASIVPVVCGHVDWAALDKLAEEFLAAYGVTPGGSHRLSGPAGSSGGGSGIPETQIQGHPLPPLARQELRQALLAFAIDAVSGPGGLAAALRTHLAGAGPLAAVSLPLDIGPASDTIPAHLRRAVLVRHRTCAWPGCAVPATACDIHHLVPRSRGGPTALRNLAPACKFHHLIAIHQWGWRLRLNPDGTTTAASPDGRIEHSHPPPDRERGEKPDPGRRWST